MSLWGHASCVSVQSDKGSSVRMKCATGENDSGGRETPEVGNEELPDASRRRLLGHAAAAAPVILTLRSGAAMAAISACERHQPLNSRGWWDWRRVEEGTTCAEQTIDVDVCLPPGTSLDQIDSMRQAESLRATTSLEHGGRDGGDHFGGCRHGQTVRLSFCQPGALYSSQAWTSISAFYDTSACG